MVGGVAVSDLDTALKEYVYEDTTDREIEQAMEAMIYNFNSMHSRMGNQTVFASVPMGVDTDSRARRVAKAFLKAYKAGLGHHEQCLWPNVMIKVKDGINFKPEDPNYDILMQALDTSSERLNPTYVLSDSSFNAPFGTNTGYMGCRTRLQTNRHGAEISESRGNIAFVTINLPMLALESQSMEAFWMKLDKYLAICARQLLHRYDVLKHLKVKDVPFIFGDNNLYMNSEGLGHDDEIEPALKNGSLTIGFCGVAEMCRALLGKSHAESDEAQKLGLAVVKHMRAFTDACAEKYDLNFSIIGSPAETTAGKFAKAAKRKFGIIPGITDREYFTNSCHAPVDLPLTAEEKMAIEGPYHQYCNGGLISYLEIDGAPKGNVTGLYELLKVAIQNDVGYFGFNYAIDHCKDCGYTGLIGDSTCPSCGKHDIRSIRRVTGYFSEVSRMGDGKRAEVHDRVSHSGRLIKFSNK